MAFATSPSRGARSTAKQKGAVKGKQSSKPPRHQRHMSAANQSPTRDSSHSSMKDSSSGNGPSRRPTGTQHTNRPEQKDNPVRHETSTFVPGRQSTYTFPPGGYYNNGPQMVLHEGYNPFRLPGYAAPTTMPTHVPTHLPPHMQPSIPVPPYPQPAVPPQQTTSPEAEELKKLKKMLEEESSKRKAEEERKRLDALEQEMKREANEAALKNMMDMKHAEEEATREIQEVKREAYNTALETVKAEEQRRRMLEEEIEQCRRMAREKVEAEMLLEEEKKRRAEQERLRIVREAEAKVAREMEERRRLRQEEEERMAQIRQEAEDRIRAQMLEEHATHFASSRKSGYLSSRSSKHSGRSSSSTTSSSRLARLSRVLQDPDEEVAAVLNSDVTPSFTRDPFTYFQGQSTTPSSLEDAERATKEPCCKCGRNARDQSSETLASRNREQELSYGDSRTVSAQRGRSRSLLPASRSKAGISEVSDSESSADEWSSASTISTASDLRDVPNLEVVHSKIMVPPSVDEDVYQELRSQSNLARYNSTSTSKSRKRSVEADNKLGSGYNFEGPGRLFGNGESRKPIASSFSVFQYLVNDESSADGLDNDRSLDDEDDKVKEIGEDDDSAEGGAILTSQNRQEASNNLNPLTKDEAEKNLVATRQHHQTETTQAQAMSSQESRLLLVLSKHINDSKQASQHNNFVDIGSPSQNWRRGQTTGSYATSHPVASDYGLNWSAELFRCFIFPNAPTGGKRMQHSAGPQRSQVTEGPAFEKTSSLVAPEYRPMVPIALMPCTILPGSVIQTFLHVPIAHDNENTVWPGQSS